MIINVKVFRDIFNIYSIFCSQLNFEGGDSISPRKFYISWDSGGVEGELEAGRPTSPRDWLVVLEVGGGGELGAGTHVCSVEGQVETGEHTNESCGTR